MCTNEKVRKENGGGGEQQWYKTNDRYAGCESVN